MTDDEGYDVGKKNTQYSKRIDEVMKAHAEWLDLKLTDKEFDKRIQLIYHKQTTKRKK